MNYKKFYEDTIETLESIINVNAANLDDVFLKADELSSYIKYCFKYDVELNNVFMEIFYFVNSMINDNSSKYAMLIKDNNYCIKQTYYINNFIQSVNNLVDKL